MTGKVGAGGVASTSATTIPHTFVGLTNGNTYVVTVNRTDATGTTKNPVASTETFKGTVSGTNFINCVRAVEGTAQAWAADTVLEILVTAYGQNQLIEGIEAEHNQDGTHKALTNLSLITPKITTSINDTNGNEVFETPATASAVNHFKPINAATGNNPVFEATGSDTNVAGHHRGKNAFNKHSGEFDNGNSSTAITINWNNGDRQKVTMTGNCTFTFSNATAGQTLTLRAVQDATGGRTHTFPTLKWPGGTVGTPGTGANDINLYIFYFDGTNYLAQLAADFS